jgi:glycosyltransferase involved in cell wall biosynthesis
VARIIALEGIQVVDVHLSRDLWTVVPAVRLVPGARVLLGKHVGSRLAKTDFLHRWIYDGVDRVLAVSQAIRRNVIETCGLPEDRVVTFHWGLELEKFVPHPRAGHQVRREYGIALDVPLVGMVGRLTPRKGHREFLVAAEAVSRAMPQTRFLVVGRHSRGEAAFERHIRDLSTQLGLEGRVIFAGHRKDIPQVMAALDLLAVPSYWEAFGWVTIEAMAMARPVVAANGGGIPDIVVPEKTGLLVSPRDVKELSAAILALLRNNDARERMGCAGRRRVEECFTIDRTADRMEAIMEELMTQGTSPHRPDTRLPREDH